MKKALAFLFAAVLAFSSCEDGEIAVQSFDFGDAPVQSCADNENEDFFLYKVSGNEVMIVVIPESELFDGVSEEVIPIDGTTYQVIYRLYDGPVNASFMCANIPPSSPKVVEEWVATGGAMRVINGANFKEIEEAGAVLPDGYQHTISFDNITFDTGTSTVTYDDDDEISFGSYQTEEANLELTTFRCEDDEPCVVDRCGTGTRLYKFTGKQALTLNLSPDTFNTLFSATVGVKTALIDADDQISYRVFNLGISAAALCGETIPENITTLEFWSAQNGVEGTSGIIEVETTTAGVGNYIHKIRLRKVNFARGPYTFTFGNTYLIGQITTSS